MASYSYNMLSECMSVMCHVRVKNQDQLKSAMQLHGYAPRLHGFKTIRYAYMHNSVYTITQTLLILRRRRRIEGGGGSGGRE